MFLGFIKKKSCSIVKKKNLCYYIKEEDLIITLSYIYCTYLGKSCIKLEDLNYYSKYIKAINCYCKIFKVSFSNIK